MVGSEDFGGVQFCEIAVIRVGIVPSAAAQAVLRRPNGFGKVELFFKIGSPLRGVLADMPERMVNLAVDAAQIVIFRDVPSPSVHIDALLVVAQLEAVPRAVFQFVFVFDAGAAAVAHVLAVAVVARCGRVNCTRPQIRQLVGKTVGAGVFKNPADAVAVVEIVAQLEQGAFVYPFLRVGLGARNPCGYVGLVLAE
ncbi:hypothetical protein NM65012_2186 [Neisseria meningitidis 65012]|nr:hypothetical protein NM65012_2186 [Neisseria meningitidis 65012]